MAFESLTDRFTGIFKKLRGQSKLTEKNMDDMLKEIRVALLEADVNFKVVKSFVNDMKEKALGQDVYSKVNPSQMLVKICHDEIEELLGKDNTELNFAKHGLTTLMLVGLRSYTKKYIGVIDDFVAENEEHIRELAEMREQDREQWKKDAPVLNPRTEQQIKEIFEGNDYEVWFPHDILLNRYVLANREMGILYAQGVVIPFKRIMEVRHGRKDLKLFTNDSMHPFVNLDFGVLPINPETGMKYKDEIAEKLSHLI